MAISDPDYRTQPLPYDLDWELDWYEKDKVDKPLKKCICGHYHCPICGNQMDELDCPTCGHKEIYVTE